MTFRRLLFWGHLAVGVIAGLVIVSMAVSGMCLAFEPQLTALSERHVQQITPSDSLQRLDPETLLKAVAAAYPEQRATILTIKSDPTASATVRLGREKIIFLNPYTGAILGEGSRLRQTLNAIENWHRWLGSRKIGKPITGAAAVSLFLLSASGLYLWWPRKLFSPNTALTGHAWNWNWHHAVGFWSAPFLLVITLTGIFMAYDVLPRAPRTHEKQVEKNLRLGDLVAQAERQNPGWTAVTLSLPKKPEDTASVFILPQPAPQDIVQKMNAWTFPLHSGRGWGLLGQTVNFFAVCAALLQIWTGFSLAWRRFNP